MNRDYITQNDIDRAYERVKREDYAYDAQHDCEFEPKDAPIGICTICNKQWVNSDKII